MAYTAIRIPSPCGAGRGSGSIALELGESTALFSLSSDAGGGEGRGEESRFYWISPLPNPPPARSSQGEGDRRWAFQCLIQWQCTPSLPPDGARVSIAGRQRAMAPVVKLRLQRHISAVARV